MIFIAGLIACSTCFGGTIMPIIRSSRVLYKWLLPVAFGACFSSCRYGVELRHTTLSSTPYRQLENQAPNTTGSNHLYNTLELLMMGIIVPETCWASNKICNKNHLLHLVGILFPHITSSTYKNTEQYKCVISGFSREVHENCALLRHYPAHSGNTLSTFRDNLPVPSSSFNKSKNRHVPKRL